jgi:hypothetical protein
LVPPWELFVDGGYGCVHDVPGAGSGIAHMDFIRPFPDGIPIGCDYTKIAVVRKVFCLKFKKSILRIFMNIDIQNSINVKFNIGLGLLLGKRIAQCRKG